MRLGIRMLSNSSTLNNLFYENQVQVLPGETATVMFQLIDESKASDKNQLGHRYIPASGSALTALITGLYTADTTKVCTQPFPLDPSIWQFTLSSTDTNTMSGVNIQFNLVEGVNIKRALGTSVLIIGPKNYSQC